MHRLEKVEEEWHQRPVDIALIDQNISLDGKDFILGTDIARSLHQNHFTGVACILTASSNNHAETLSQLTGVDLVLPKGTPPATGPLASCCLPRSKRIDSRPSKTPFDAKKFTMAWFIVGK